MSALAELQIFHSRPFAPTRRIALGQSSLPVDPAPGPGGILLGAVVAGVEGGPELEVDDVGGGEAAALNAATAAAIWSSL